MIARNLPGISNEQERDKIILDIANSVYWYRREGKNDAADFMEKTIDALSEIRFEN